jgi:hypothetical protein
MIRNYFDQPSDYFNLMAPIPTTLLKIENAVINRLISRWQKFGKRLRPRTMNFIDDDIRLTFCDDDPFRALPWAHYIKSVRRFLDYGPVARI